ncbi:MAG: DNA gyrase subunit A [Clostridia bacterium]|nr:DNA gyrase subunit A [Clostridia bacterium]
MTESIAFPNQKIEERNMEKEVRKSFLEYSMSVITSRALPDVRDGMKPGQRRILYAMYEDHLTYDKPFRKSATTVGNVLGRYHPHGDVAVYDTMVHMAQSFYLRYPLVEGHGNFGNVDGDGAAAYRYTEARMSKIADYMLSDIDKKVVPMARNFDNTRDEPVVLPSRFPNILVNGSWGIAVGMATKIPQHNLGEVIDGTIYRMENPASSVDELMEYIKGPDFPTYGIIYGSRGIKEAYETGKGRILVRARAKIEPENHRIVITEIPYGVNKSMLVTSIADLYREKRIEGLTALRDESGRGGMRIVVEYRRDANGEVILNQLYKYTQLQDTCAVNMLALVNGEPKILSLPAILDYYIAFQREIITNRTRFELEKALAEMHIYEGYKIAIDHIDEVIATIKASESIPAAKESLMARFGLSDAQAQAIVEMTLGKLSGLERQKIEDRLAKLSELVEKLEGILADPAKIDGIIKEEMLEIKRRFADKRRTELTESVDDIDLEDLIPRGTCVITVTHAGYMKRQKVSDYNAQARGGMGKSALSMKEEDFVQNVLVCNTHSHLLVFTDKGKVYTMKAYRIPEASRTAKGSNVVNLLAIEPGEKVTAFIAVKEFDETSYLTMVTKRGIIKRTLLSEYEYQRKGGKIALSLDEGDSLLFVRLTAGEGELLLATRNGNAVRFAEANVRAMGRTARGVIGIRLEEDDEVVGVAVVDEEKTLLTITEKGLGKRTRFTDFREMKHRGGSGVVCHKLTERSGKLCSVAVVDGEDDIMMITDEGTIIRTHVDSIPTLSRTAAGVIVMRLSADASIISFARLEREEEKAEEAEKEDAENAENAEDVPTESAESLSENAEENAEEGDENGTEDGEDGEI